MVRIIQFLVFVSHLFYLLEKHGNFEKKENIKCIFIWICHRRFLDIVAEMLFVTKWGE